MTNPGWHMPSNRGDVVPAGEALSSFGIRHSSLVIRVGTAGMQTTVQDLGRFGYGRYGLPVSGALDDFALRWANLLVGNEPGAAALEFTLLGPTLTLEGERPVAAALAGADFGATLNGASVTPWRSFTLRPGDTLALGGCQWGARGYLAVAGGIT